MVDFSLFVFRHQLELLSQIKWLYQLVQSHITVGNIQQRHSYKAEKCKEFPAKCSSNEFMETCTVTKLLNLQRRVIFFTCEKCVCTLNILPYRMIFNERDHFLQSERNPIKIIHCRFLYPPKYKMITVKHAHLMIHVSVTHNIGNACHFHLRYMVCVFHFSVLSIIPIYIKLSE